MKNPVFFWAARRARFSRNAVVFENTHLAKSPISEKNSTMKNLAPCKQAPAGKSSRLSLVLLCAGLLALASPSAWAVSFTWLDVGDANNSDDTATGFGGVAAEYRISSTEVTNAQYTEFLNAIAATDTFGVYDSNMDITQAGSSGSFTYTAIATYEDRALNNANFFDAMRFINWIENGQPTGSQDASTTEDGTYAISDGVSETRAGGATYFLPSEDEWYKAAYYDPDDPDADLGGNVDYWLHANQSDTAPTAEAPPGGANSANYAGTTGDTSVVGAYTSSTSYYGGYDFGGNVYEWTEGLEAPDRVIRGGSYTTAAAFLAANSRTTLAPGGGSFEGGVGFRVAGLIDAPEDSSDPLGPPDFGAIPEPSRAVLLLMGLVGMLLRRRR